MVKNIIYKCFLFFFFPPAKMFTISDDTMYCMNGVSANC